MILMVSANGLLLYAVHKTPITKSFTATKVYIANQAVTGLLVGVCQPTIWTMSLFKHPRQYEACLFVQSVILVLFSTSIFNLLAAFLDRYLSILHSFSTLRVETVKKAYGIVSLLWVLALLLGSIPLMGWAATSRKDFEGTLHCNYLNVVPLEYDVYLQFFGIVLPCLVITLFVLIHIYVYFHKVSTAVESRTRTRLNRRGRASAKLLRTLAMCYFLLVVTQAPLQLTKALMVWGVVDKEYLKKHGVEYTILFMLKYTHAFFVPLFLCVNQQKYRTIASSLILSRTAVVPSPQVSVTNTPTRSRLNSFELVIDKSNRFSSGDYQNIQ